MKKSIVLILCCFFYLPLQVWSQDYKLVWGIADEQTQKMTPLEIVCKDSTGYYVLLREGSSITRHLAKYDLNMNLKWTISLELKISKNKNARYLDLFSFNNKILLLVYDYDKLTSTRKIFALNVSPSGIIDAAYREICTIKAPNLYQEYHFSDIQVNETEIRFESIFENEQMDQIQLSFEFNKELELIEKSRHQTDSLKLEYAEIENLNLSSTDSNYYYFIPSKKVENEIEKEILVVQNKYTKTVKKVELDIGNYNVAGLIVDIDTISKYLNVSGIYEDMEATFIGTFILKIDLLTIKITSTDIKPFSNDLVNLVKNIKVIQSNNQQTDKMNVTLKGYSDKEILFNDYGDFYYIFEQTSKNLGSFDQSISPYYFYKNALIITFDKMGNLKWTAFLPKYQQSSIYSAISFGSFIYNNELYIMYNDNPKNLIMESTNVHIAQGHSTFSFVSLKFDKDGKMEKETILPASNKSHSICVEPQSLKLFGDDVILIAKEGENYKIGKLTLK